LLGHALANDRAIDDGRLAQDRRTSAEVMPGITSRTAIAAST